jgi:hypothetical protein
MTMIPVGDFLRGLGDKLPKWLRTVLQFTKGMSIRRGGIEIGLNKDHTIDGDKPFNKPHLPGR